jgi:hypothetical protein
VFNVTAKESGPMRDKLHGRTAAGIAGLVGTGGLGLAVFTTGSSHNRAFETCALLVASFVVTGLVAMLRLVLSYRLGKLALQTEAAALDHQDSLQRMHLELQRSILERIDDGAEGARAYVTMTSAKTMAHPVEPGTSCPLAEKTGNGRPLLIGHDEFVSPVRSVELP